MSDRVIPIQSQATLPIPALRAPLSSAPHDTRGRPLRDLRISVTDRCNFRCTYCMPKDVFNDDYAFLPHGELLTFEEIVRVATVARGLGMEKVRLTGGEPLLRRGIESLIAQLTVALPGIDIALTTNGSALKAKAKALKDAGLQRITVSLDSLDDKTFRAMNDADFPVAKVLEAIDAAADAGLGPIKINMVVKRGVNDHQVLDMARHFKGSGHIVRFIEFMDVGATNGWRMDDVIPSAEIVKRIHAEFPLAAIDANYDGEVAERWRYADGSGEIGVISSVTQAFCANCTRARLSTDGQLFTCLFAAKGYDLKALLRGGADDAAIRDAIGAIWLQRADRYSEIRTAETAKGRKVEMSFIGG
ncbi:MAG: GTP 3',8-cyclase MoaA [Betaproteobacteria bacterium]|nr:GTP 3',8-cyclase MoaA [Betaproteobacteria bacterium]